MDINTLNSSQGMLDIEELIKTHLPALRAYIASRGVSSNIVDDIAQDVFLVAFKNQEKYDRQYAFKSWIFGIAKNIILKEIEYKQN